VFDTGRVTASIAEHDPAPGADRRSRVERLRALVDRTRPVTLAEQRVLPVLPTLEQLLTTGAGAAGLRRGSVVGVAGYSGATTLALALAAGPTRSGSWAAFVGLPELGWAAAEELGVDLSRVVVVRPTASARPTVVAALLDAFDVVVVGFDGAPGAVEARRLAARARERGSVLVVVGGRIGGVGRSRRAWPTGTEVELTVVESTWSGLEEGAGHLRQRRAVVEVGGRGGWQRARRVELLLPGPAGQVSVVEERSGADAVVTPLRRVG